MTIIDDDDPGIVGFQSEAVDVLGSEVEVVAIRRGGAHGKQTFKITTEAGTAKEDVDYFPMEEEGEFEHEEIEKKFTIKIPMNKRVRDGKEFRVVMSDLEGGAKFNADTDGGEETCICTVVFVKEDHAMIQAAKQSLANNWEAARIGSTTYAQQFRDCIYVNGSPEDQVHLSEVFFSTYDQLLNEDF